MWGIFGTVAGHFDIQNISFTVSQVGWNIQSTHEKNHYSWRYSGIWYTWYSLPCWKSNPSIFVKSTVARWQLLQGEEKSCPLESGQFYKLNLSSDMILPRHFVTSFVSKFLPSQVTRNTFPTTQLPDPFIDDTVHLAIPTLPCNVIQKTQSFQHETCSYNLWISII